MRHANAGPMKLMKLGLAVVGASLGIALAVPAHADPDADDLSAAQNQGFLTSLRQLGIGFADSDRAVLAGRSVCGFIDRGASGLQLLNDIRSENPALSISGAAQFATIAAKSYCPQQIEPTK